MRRVLEPVSERADEGKVTDRERPTGKKRTQTKVTEFYEESEDAYRRKKSRTEQMSGARTSIPYGPEKYDTAGRYERSLPEIHQNKNTGGGRTYDDKKQEASAVEPYERVSRPKGIRDSPGQNNRIGAGGSVSRIPRRPRQVRRR